MDVLVSASGDRVRRALRIVKDMLPNGSEVIHQMGMNSSNKCIITFSSDCSLPLTAIGEVNPKVLKDSVCTL